MQPSSRLPNNLEYHDVLILSRLICRGFQSLTVFALSLITTLAYWLNFALSGNELRAGAALAVSAQFLTLSIMADQGREQRWRYAAIVMFTIGMVLCGWSWLTPGVDATWLNRSVILMLEAWGLTAVYGLLRDKANARFPEWTSSARACVPWLLGGGVVALLFCVATEISHQINFGAVQIHPAPLVAIGLTLVAAVVACVYFALSPEHDPLSLSERWRAKYVYVAEVMLALLFLHIRLTMPWLFTGFIERYWPMVIMLIAYFGVVASEALKPTQVVGAGPTARTNRRVSADASGARVLVCFIGSRLLVAAVYSRRIVRPVVDTATIVWVWTAGGSRRKRGALVHVESHCGLPVSATSAVVADSGCAVSALRGLYERRQAERRSDDGHQISFVSDDLRFINRRHLHQWRCQLSVAAVDPRRILALRCVRGNSLSRSWIAPAGRDLLVAVDCHDDLLRVCKFRLDVAVVRRRDCDWSDDHLHVRGV